MKNKGGRDRMAILSDSLKLLRELSTLRYGLTIQEMQDRLNVSRRTVYRYLDAFKEADIPLEQIRDVVRDTSATRWRIPIKERPKVSFITQTA
jgi:predicted DNA-binding transcriptional regulator YafY